MFKVQKVYFLEGFYVFGIGHGEGLEISAWVNERGLGVLSGFVGRFG